MKTKECYEKHENCNGTECNLTRYKWVDFAYPTSDNAKKHGAYDTGCWIVYTSQRGKPGKVFTAHLTQDKAIKSANTLPCEWWELYLSQGRKTKV